MKKKKKEIPENLILVSRPINFLYSIELCRSLPEQTFLIFIFRNSNKQEQNAINFLKDNFEKYLPNAQFQNFPFHYSLGTPVLILFDWYLKLFFKGRYFRTFSTSGGVKGRLFFKHISVDEVIITDEGVGSLKKFPLMLEENRLWTEPISEFYKKLYKMLKVDDLRNGAKFNFWTMYKELVPLDEKVRLNTFAYLKEIIDLQEFKVNQNEVIILGTNPGSLGLEEKDYIKSLETVKKEHVNFQVFLKPHKTHNKLYGNDPLNTDYPIEYFFLARKAIPRLMFSFNSTSNQVLEYLFPHMIVKNIKVEADDIYSSTDL